MTQISSTRMHPSLFDGFPSSARDRSPEDRSATRRSTGFDLPNGIGANIYEAREMLRLRLKLALVVSDVTAVLAALALGSLFRFDTLVDHEVARNILIILPLFLLLSIGKGGYSTAVLINYRKGVLIALGSVLAASAAALALLFFFRISDSVSRAAFGIGVALAVLFLFAARIGFGIIAKQLANDRFTTEVVLVDGVDTRDFELARNAFVLNADCSHIAAGDVDPLLLDRIGHLLRRCDRVILACHPERRARWIELLRGLDVDVDLLVPEIDVFGPLRLRHHGPHAALGVGCKPLSLRHRILKRALDLAIAVSLMLPLLPLFVVVALAIRLDSPGPIIFRQQRVGRGNRIFSILKFRTMRAAEADSDGTLSTRRNDDRITAVGSILRKTSIDEIPQLFNVILGHMSIAGPRPHAMGSTAEDLLFWQIEPRYFERHAVKPGMTGLAQVRGFRGATARREDLSHRLNADLEYLSGWSIWRDLWIIGRTVGVCVQRNAF